MDVELLAQNVALVHKGAVGTVTAQDLARAIYTMQQVAALSPQLTASMGLLGRQPVTHHTNAAGWRPNNPIKPLVATEQPTATDDEPPALSEDSALLSRTQSLSSVCSNVSSMSTSCESESSQALVDGFDDLLQPKRNDKRRKARTLPGAQVLLDRKRVKYPVLRALDTTYLAPRQSPLFKRQYLAKPNKDGTRSLKRYKTLVVSLFKRLLRPVLRQLLQDAVVDANDQQNGQPALITRYYDAAVHVVSKRRSNHMQSWRHSGKPLPLRYGADVTFSLGHNGPSPAPVVTAAVPLHQKITKTLFKATPADNASSAIDFSDEESQVDGFFDGDTTEEEEIITCAGAGCQKRLGTADAFPKTAHFNAGSEACYRCSECWDIHMETNLIPLMKAGNKKRSSNTSKGCKCGATDHKTSRSKKCPLNPANAKKSTLSSDKPSPPKKRRKNPKEANITPPLPTKTTTKKKNTTKKNTTKPTTKKTPPPKPTTKKTPPPKPTTRKSPPRKPTTKKTPPPKPTIYKAGDNVFAKHKNQWYHAHISWARPNGNYDIYFPADGMKKQNVLTKNLKNVDKSSSRTLMCRYDCLNKVFMFEGDNDCKSGHFKVRALFNKTSEFKCVRVSGSGLNVDNFDIGYVMNVMKEEKELERLKNI